MNKIIDGYEKFIDGIFSKLEQLGLDLSEFQIDHLAYQTSTNENYDNLKPILLEISEQLREPLVGGRRVGIFKFHKPLEYKGQTIKAIELIAPTEEQHPESALEHLELTSKMTLEQIMKKYPKLEWNDSAINREQFPMLKLRLDEKTQVKFPRTGLLHQ